MPIQHLRIEGVRCLQGVDLGLDPRKNYIWGANGAGKTSCLEAIYLLSRGRSFRLRQTSKLVRHGADTLSVFAEVAAGDGHKSRLGLEFGPEGLRSRLDGEPVRSQADLLRKLPVHVIDPRLHQLVESGPSERRRYIDTGVFHVEHSFLDAWRSYRRALGQRNAALKARVSPAELQLWTQPLVQAALEVTRLRAEYVAALGATAGPLCTDLLGRSVRLDYRQGWRKGVEFAEVLEESLESDRASGFTQNGPHRADLKLDFEDGGIRDLASRGQQKLVAAALVIAQVRLFENQTGRTSTLLVDDASAELDQNAQARLLDALQSLDSQLVITGLSAEALRPEPGFPVFHVEQGTVRLVL